MNRTIGFLLLSFAFAQLSCKNEPIELIEPFELTVGDYDYASAYSVLYRLTDQKLTITFRGELEGEKDSIIFSTTDLPKSKIRKLSKINLDSLNVLYMNNCVSDGDVKVFGFRKDSIYKQVQLNNYYHAELSPAIAIINEVVPERFMMYYSKEDLLESMDNCNNFKIVPKWEDLKIEK